VVLDIITFLIKCNDSPSNVKSLETIMDSIDEGTKNILNDVF